MFTIKNIIFDLWGVLFNPNPSSVLASACKPYAQPITSMIDLLHDCKKQGLHIYLLSNADNNTIDRLATDFPDIFNQFNGIVTAQQAGAKKPHELIFTYLLDTYALNPQECVFIDDSLDNIYAAKQIGMYGIAYTRPEAVKAYFKELNII